MATDTLDLTKPLSDQDLKKIEKFAISENPLFLVEEKYLTIKTKAGELKRLELNTVQKRLLAKIRDIERRGKPVRLWVLKARQAGISTLIEAILYADTSQREATNSLVLADDIDGANYLFGMQKLFHERLYPHLRPQIKHSNEKKLEFEHIHSQVLIDTADNLKAGRKYTFRKVHLSEVAFYRNLKILMLGLNPAVPSLPGTMIVGETTANGIGNQFYDEWQEAEKGITDWETFFLGWQEIPEYSKPLQNGQLYPIEAIQFPTAGEREKFLADEQVLKEKYSLTAEQLNWRRWAIVNLCDKKVQNFNQEFPDCPETAFISTGDLFFSKEGLKRQEIIKPVAIGNIVREEGSYVLREDAGGLFKIYELPKRGGQYVVGADTAQGLENGDKSSAVVIDKHSNRTVCAYNHNISPDRFTEDLTRLGHYYNDALIACENQGYGYSVNQDLYKQYGLVYRRIKTKKGFGEQTLELGWNTNKMTRPQMLAQLAEEILDGSTELNDKDLIQQCWTFINNVKRGEPEAEQGKQDDVVIARAIAGQVRLEQPYKEKVMPQNRTRKRYRGLSGY